MKRILIYIILSFILAIIGHGYVIYRFISDGILFTGPNDGMEQMVPIQMYLYDKWSQGQWFYATDFGLGGDFFTDLSYYFSTNILFILNVLFIFAVDLCFHLNTQDVIFWMTNAIVISIIKSSLAMLATFGFVRRITNNTIISLLTSYIFVISPIYFRFTVYWPFFSDIFILLPLLLWSIELYLQKGKKGIFILIVTLSLINNFYFAYYQLVVGLIYFIARLIFKHRHDIIPRFKAIYTLSTAALLSLGCSLFFFYHGIQAYLNNRRIPFDGNVDAFEPFNQNTNLFYDNYLIVILYIVIQALLSFKLYKHFYFKLFAIFMIMSIGAHFLPFVDQLFNGFSAPQKRWHYLIAFNAAMLMGLYAKYFSTLTIKNYIFSSIVSLGFVFVSAWVYDTYVSWLWFTPIVSLVGLLVLCVKASIYRNKLSYFYYIAIMILATLVADVFIRNQIYFEDHVERANNDYVNASLFNTPLQHQLVSQMNYSKSEDERIDWRVNEQDNTPMYQFFKGTSIYSSIFDHNILDYYYDALKINLQSESVSRYQSTNGRQNINSLFSIKYLMLKDYQDNVPAYFKKVESKGQYQIYENTLNLPSVKVTNHLYDAQKLKTPIDREHAMLDGVIINDKGKSYTDNANNLKNSTDISSKNIDFRDNNQIYLPQSNGSIQIHVPSDLRERYTDFYLTLKIRRGQPDSNYTININNYANQRLYNNSTYKTGVETQLYRTQPDENGNINITLSPNGNYHFKILSLHGENYNKLKRAFKLQQNNHYKDIKNGVKMTLAPHQKGIATVNIPFRDSMIAYVDHKKVKPIKVNYMMTGIPVSENDSNIVIKYRPKYWFTMITISAICIVISVFWCLIKKFKFK